MNRLTVINHLILNEITCSTVSYDQDANRSRRFNTNVGGLLEFHCFMLYTVFPICGYMDCYLVLSQDLFITKNYTCMYGVQMEDSTIGNPTA